jgi:hypothetical protein
MSSKKKNFEIGRDFLFFDKRQKDRTNPNGAGFAKYDI